jgi:hypothetical protein
MTPKEIARKIIYQYEGDGVFELEDAIANALAASERALEQAKEALKALTIWSQNGSQLCFRSHNNIPMGMSKKQERLARAALRGDKK